MTDAMTDLSAPVVSRTRERSVALRIHPQLPMLMLGPGMIAQQLTDTPIASVPNCARWFCGVARHGGHIVPFFDIALWVGMERPAEQIPVMVSVTSGPHSVGVLAVESPLILPAGQSVAPWSDKDALASEGTNSRMAFEFDPRAWLAQIASSITAQTE
jgi:hypothetical protein